MLTAQYRLMPVAEELIPTVTVIPVYVPVDVDVAVGLTAAPKEKWVRLRNDVIRMTADWDRTVPRVEKGQSLTINII